MLIFVLEGLHEQDNDEARGWAVRCLIPGRDKDLLHNVHKASYSINTGVKRPEREAGHYLEFTFGSRAGVCK